MLTGFVIVNIPPDAPQRTRYGTTFDDYSKKMRKLIPSTGRPPLLICSPDLSFTRPPERSVFYPKLAHVRRA